MVAFNKYVMNALTRKGSKQELLDFLEFVAGVNRVTSLCGDVRYLLTLTEGPRARQSRREFGCGDRLHGHDQVPVQHRYSKIEHPIPTEMRRKDQSAAIILVEDLTWAHSDANSWDIQTLPARKLQLSKFSGERVGQRVKSASSPVALRAPSASVNRQRTFDEAKWASQLCWEPNETAAVDGAGSAEGSLEIAAPAVDDPLIVCDVNDSQMR